MITSHIENNLMEDFATTVLAPVAVLTEEMAPASAIVGKAVNLVRDVCLRLAVYIARDQTDEDLMRETRRHILLQGTEGTDDTVTVKLDESGRTHHFELVSPCLELGYHREGEREDYYATYEDAILQVTVNHTEGTLEATEIPL